MYRLNRDLEILTLHVTSNSKKKVNEKGNSQVINMQKYHNLHDGSSIGALYVYNTISRPHLNDQHGSDTGQAGCCSDNLQGI